jgi:two-component system NtrC family sensor kinase
MKNELCAGMLLLCIAVTVAAVCFALGYLRQKAKYTALRKLILSRGDDEAQDITEKIILSKQHLETTFDAIPDSICVIDRDFSIVRVNKSYARFVKKPIPEILNKRCHAVLWGRETPCEDCPAMETFATGKKVLGRQVAKEVDGDLHHFDMGTYPVLDEERKAVNAIEYLRDITEEKRIMEQLFRSEKLASIGIMTTGIAHEMNNSLSGIAGNAANLLQMPEKYDLNEKGLSRIRTILECAEQATRIMKDLLHLSRRNEDVHTLADLNGLVEKTVNSSIHAKGYETIERVLRLDTSLPAVLCDPPKIEQVIINIITNATQSILEKRALYEREGRAYAGKLSIATHIQNATVRISVTDNGMGVPEAIRGKLFDPFFTTRPPGQGTGLGLSICHRIIEEHRGRIFFESTPHETTFFIVLPLGAGRRE